MTLEELPPVLVLHLKRFVFEKTGGCQKLSKNIDYPVDLEISKGRASSGAQHPAGFVITMAQPATRESAIFCEIPHVGPRQAAVFHASTGSCILARG